MTPLNVRNNDPGNMRPFGRTKGFQTFASPGAGLDAMRKDLLLKINGQSNAMKANFGEGYQPSLRNLISTWAPPSENNTDGYIQFVSQKTGLKPDHILRSEDVEKIIPAMIEQEGGGKAASYFNAINPSNVRGPNNQPAHLGVNPEGDADNVYDKNARKPVDDPDLLAKLNAPERKPVSDPAILAQLNGETGQIQQKPSLSPAQEFQNEHPLIRTLGRGGRTVASGAASIADLALLPVKTGALGAGLAAENMGAEGLGKSLQRLGQTPSMAETTKALIDKATGGRLKPTGTIDAIGDFAGEMISSAVPFSKGDDVVNALKSPTVKDAVKAVLNPQGKAERVFINKYPAPEKITADIIKSRATEAYQAAKQSGGVIKREAVDRFVDKIFRTARPQDEVARALTKDDPANAALEVFDTMVRGKEMDLDRLQAVDEALSRLIDNYVEFGAPKKEALGLMKIQDELREMVETATDEDIVGKAGFEALNEARKLWSKAAKLRDIERILTRAQGMKQPASAMKAGFNTLYNNPKRMRGFSKEEAAAIKKAAQSGIIDEILIAPASRLTGILSGALGGVPGYVAGKTVEVSARGGAASLQANRAKKIAELIANGKPSAPGPLLTYQGGAAALALTNSAGQKLLPKPDNRELARLLAQ